MGQGYVGLPLAMAAAEAGHHVVGFEPDKRRCDMLASGISYIEDVPSSRIVRRMEEGLYEPTTEETKLTNFDVAVITVPTPLRKGVPDLTYVQQAASTLGLYLKEGATVILESTVAPGTTREVVIPLLETPSELTVGEDFHVGFSPERIDPGNEAWYFGNTPKIVSGLTPRCRNIVAAFYSTITENVVVAQTLEEAELAKVFENTYRQVNIALVNELQRHAHLLGVDVHHVLDLAATKPFGFTKFTPGPGVGGHCLPVDPVYLTHKLRTEHGAAFRIVELAQEINESQPAYVVHRLQQALNMQALSLSQSSILVLGQAYKPDTADMRESPAVEVARLLREACAQVTVVDPHFAEEDIHVLKQIPDGSTGGPSVADYDAVLLLTPHTAFDLQLVADQATYVLDTRGVLPVAPNIERL
jgi:UDP-N-acetyl-D-glucosamine dehydrogenase